MSDQPIEPTDGGEGAPEEQPTEDRAADGSPVDKLQRERDDYYDRLLRKTAEFDNFRKRVDRERREMAEWAGADILTEVVSVMDDFERALAAPAPPEAKPYKAGVELIHKQLNEFLKKHGVTKVEPLGADFDPHLHQAVAYEEVPGAREGEVVDVLAYGYKLRDRLLRPALVKVAKAS
jgi:molecular chaperone GrpE